MCKAKAVSSVTTTRLAIIMTMSSLLLFPFLQIDDYAADYYYTAFAYNSKEISQLILDDILFLLPSFFHF